MRGFNWMRYSLLFVLLRVKINLVYSGARSEHRESESEKKLPHLNAPILEKHLRKRFAERKDVGKPFLLKKG